mmetsp:Transcript_54021/g.107218  ORF Transcript_54021/g.107218 Transcript_54021/m.107218 type:complete len:209 (+) Transcript_54021:987-1613(+)
MLFGGGARLPSCCSPGFCGRHRLLQVATLQAHLLERSHFSLHAPKLLLCLFVLLVERPRCFRVPLFGFTELVLAQRELGRQDLNLGRLLCHFLAAVRFVVRVLSLQRVDRRLLQAADLRLHVFAVLPQCLQLSVAGGEVAAQFAGLDAVALGGRLHLFGRLLQAHVVAKLLLQRRGFRFGRLQLFRHHSHGCCLGMLLCVLLSDLHQR